MTQPVIGPRKAGLNYEDVNVVRKGIEEGKSLVEIQTVLFDIAPAAIEACYRHYGPKEAPTFQTAAEPPPPSLDEELGGARPSKTKK